MNTLKLHDLSSGETSKAPRTAPMSAIETAPTKTSKTEPWRYVLLGVIAIYVIVSLYFIFDTRSRLASFEKAQKAAIQRLSERQASADDELNASLESLAGHVEVAEQELHQRMQAGTTDLRRQQQALEKRLQKEQVAQKEQIGQVSGQVADVHNELGSAKVDIATTRADLETTKVKLDRAIGDLTGQSSLIARTREELEELKHRGDRNYYEFVLSKGARPTAVLTVSLQLKKVNEKKNQFTLNVIADDRKIEKKDRGVAEPLQFYTGRNRLLYEVVIFSVGKNEVTGYLSTPKSAGTGAGTMSGQ